MNITNKFFKKITISMLSASLTIPNFNTYHSNKVFSEGKFKEKQKEFGFTGLVDKIGKYDSTEIQDFIEKNFEKKKKIFLH